MLTLKIVKKQIAYNRSRRTDKIKNIVIHDTGNTGKGANAESHYRYFNGGDRESSADFFVDDIQALQANDYTKYYTWHCGDGHGRYGITNNNSIGIEICINSDGDYNKAVDNTVELVQYLMKELNIDINHVVRHYDASRKNCPQSMSGNNWARWTKFEQKLTEDIDMEELNALKSKVAELENKLDKLSKANGGSMIYNYVDKNMPSWAHEAVQWLVDKGILAGAGEGLNLSETKLWTCVMLYRVIKFVAKLINVKI